MPDRTGKRHPDAQSGSLPAREPLGGLAGDLRELRAAAAPIRRLVERDVVAPINRLARKLGL